MQVIDWISLLIDAHYAQIALSSDTPDLHARLQTAVQTQVHTFIIARLIILFINNLLLSFCSVGNIVTGFILFNMCIFLVYFTVYDDQCVMNNFVKLTLVSSLNLFSFYCKLDNVV